MWFRSKRKTRNLGKTITVTITVRGDNISVSPDPVQVSKQELEQIEWQLKGEQQDFFVDIDGPVFTHGSHFDNFRRKSGPVRYDVETGIRVKYAVTVGDLEIDPQIIVH